MLTMGVALTVALGSKFAGRRRTVEWRPVSVAELLGARQKVNITIETRDSQRIIQQTMFLRIGLLGSSALQSDQLEKPTVLQC